MIPANGEMAEFCTKQKFLAIKALHILHARQL